MTSLPIALPDLPGAACADTTYPDDYFPGKWDSGADAKAMCRKCPEVASCLQWALDNDEQFGIWGGLDEVERRRLVRKSTTKESA